MEKNHQLSTLTTEQVSTIQNFEKEFKAKYGEAVYLLAFNQDKSNR